QPRPAQSAVDKEIVLHFRALSKFFVLDRTNFDANRTFYPPSLQHTSPQTLEVETIDDDTLKRADGRASIRPNPNQLLTINKNVAKICLLVN
ncbi:MAG TPA: hypothetical protein VF905_02520, partial [Nitrospirota bacterium]